MKTKLVNIDIRKNYVDTLLKARGIENPEDYTIPVENSCSLLLTWRMWNVAPMFLWEPLRWKKRF